MADANFERLLTKSQRSYESVRAQELFLAAVSDGKIPSYQCDIFYDLSFLEKYAVAGTRFLWGIQDNGCGTNIVKLTGLLKGSINEQCLKIVLKACRECYELTVYRVEESEPKWFYVVARPYDREANGYAV